MARFNYGLGQSTQDYLTLISQYESSNRNIPNYRYGPGYTAQGYYQITNTNWNKIAPILGIDTSMYPNAMSAPQDIQAQVAMYLLTQTPGGISNWSNYNPKLMAALSYAGMQTSGPVTDSGPPATSGALVDISGSAAATPTSSILDELSQAGLPVDTSSPVTGVIVAGGALLAALLVGRVI
jgi:hypothetical protein